MPWRHSTAKFWVPTYRLWRTPWPWWISEKSTKAGLVDAMITAIEKNRACFKDKAKWAGRVTNAIAFQAGFTVIVGAIQLWIG